MKIFISFLQAKEQHPIAAYSFWEYYIKNGIKEAGHQWTECEEVDWARGLVNQTAEDFNSWKTFTWEKTVEHLKKHKPDLFLSYLYPQQIDENAIAEIKKMGVFCVNFFCDNVRLFKKAPTEFGIFDLNWVPEHKAIKMYKKAKLPSINLPMPIWIDPKYRTLPLQEDKNITFIGSRDIQRHQFFEKILEICPQFEIDIYGKGWVEDQESTFNPSFSMFGKIKNQFSFLSKNGIVPFVNKLKYKFHQPEISENLIRLLKRKPDFDDYIKITRESGILLGINRYPSFNFSLHKPDTYSRLRDIEAPMLGACYLTEWTEGLDELYEIGTEILTYKDGYDLIIICEELKKNKELRKKLRINGQKKALYVHHIGSSIQKIINQI